MKLKLPGQLWNFKQDDKGDEVGHASEYSDKNEVYVDRLHQENLGVYQTRQEHKWDNWIIYCGDEGDGKSTKAKQDCYIMAHNCGGIFDNNKIAWDAETFGKLIDESKPGDSVLYDEAITGLSSKRAMSQVNHVLKIKATMCRKKRLFIAICIPSLFDVEKSIAIRRSLGMVKVYADKARRGYFVYYNKTQKRMLYIKGKQFEDMNAVKGGPASRFLNWSMLNETEYEEMKDKAQLKINTETEVVNKYKEQRNALINIMIKEFNCTQVKVSQLLNLYTKYSMQPRTLSDVYKEFKMP